MTNRRISLNEDLNSKMAVEEDGEIITLIPRSEEDVDTQYYKKVEAEPTDDVIKLLYGPQPPKPIDG